MRVELTPEVMEKFTPQQQEWLLRHARRQQGVPEPLPPVQVRNPLRVTGRVDQQELAEKFRRRQNAGLPTFDGPY